MIKQLAHLFYYTLRIPQFPQIQGVSTINEMVIAFMVAILVISGFTERDIIGLLALMMAGCGIFLSLGRGFYTRHRNLVVRSLMVLTSSGMAIFAFNGDAIGAVCFTIAASSIICARDILATQLHVGIREQSEYHGTDTAQMFAFVMGFGIIFSASILALFGLIADQNLSVVLTLLSLMTLAIGVTIRQTHPSPSDKGEESNSSVIRNSEIPRSVYTQCFLSFCYNAVSYFSRRLAVPLLVIEAGRRFGFSDSLFSVLGLTVGLLALLGLISQRVKGGGRLSSQSLMFLNYFFGICAWVSIGGGLYAIEHFSEVAVYWTLIGLIAVILGAEVSSKLWSIGFMETIKAQAILHGGQCPNKTTELQRAFLGVFLWMKNLGAAAGFFLAFLMYDLGTIGVMSSLSILAAVYGLFAWKALTGQHIEAETQGA